MLRLSKLTRVASFNRIPMQITWLVEVKKTNQSIKQPAAVSFCRRRPRSPDRISWMQFAQNRIPEIYSITATSKLESVHLPCASCFCHASDRSMAGEEGKSSRCSYQYVRRIQNLRKKWKKFGRCRLLPRLVSFSSFVFAATVGHRHLVERRTVSSLLWCTDRTGPSFAS